MIYLNPRCRAPPQTETHLKWKHSTVANPKSEGHQFVGLCPETHHNSKVLGRKVDL